MKHRNIIERRRDRAEFVYMYMQEIRAIIDSGMSRKDREEFVDNIARKHLEYSEKTCSLDIFFAIRKSYDNLIKLQS